MSDELSKKVSKIASGMSKKAAGDIDLDKSFQKLYEKVAVAVAKQMNGVKGVEKVVRQDRMKPNRYLFTFTAKGYTSSDFEASCTVVLEFGSRTSNILIWASRPDWGKHSTELLREDLGNIVPVKTILSKLDLTFGNH